MSAKDKRVFYVLLGVIFGTTLLWLWVIPFDIRWFLTWFISMVVIGLVWVAQ